jgi:hypothetical protein
MVQEAVHAHNSCCVFPDQGLQHSTRTTSLLHDVVLPEGNMRLDYR